MRWAAWRLLIDSKSFIAGAGPQSGYVSRGNRYAVLIREALQANGIRSFSNLEPGVPHFLLQRRWVGYLDKPMARLVLLVHGQLHGPILAVALEREAH